LRIYTDVNVNVDLALKELRIFKDEKGCYHKHTEDE